MTVMPNIHHSSDDEDDNDILDSDEELQKAFARGELKSGTYQEITPKEKVVNDVSGLEAKLALFTRVKLPWLERLDITVAPEEEEGADEADEKEVQDDFKRELQFYRQAESAALLALAKLHKEKIPTKRPDDYFAQMIKSDDQMRKVREKLLSKSLAAEKSEKAKKMRELKKMGKKVQVEVLKSRQKGKREMLEQVKKYRKGQQDRLDFLEGDMPSKKGGPQKGGKDKKISAKDSHRTSNKRRDWKNKKFGFGGQKKRSKSNTKESHDDTRDYSISKNSKGSKRGAAKSTMKNKRPGKSKRQEMKSRK